MLNKIILNYYTDKLSYNCNITSKLSNTCVNWKNL